MKPLTIEELKVGDWVWVVDIESPKHGSGYWQIHGFAETHIHLNQGAARWVAPKALYGKDWVAYRNKEIAEGHKDTQTVKLVLQKTGCDNVECTWTDTAIVEVTIPAKYNLDENKHPNNATLTTWHIVGAVTEENKQ